MTEEHVFENSFCGQYMTEFLTQDLQFSFMKLGPSEGGYDNA